MRIRTIKPAFWLNEDLSTVSSDAALLAIGLLNYADDEGYFNANPLLIKAAIFPIRQTKDIAKILLPELVKIGYVVALTDSSGRIYGMLPNFSVHQVINKKTPSKISCLELLQYDYGSGVVGLPTGKEGKVKEGKGRESDGKIRKLEDLNVELILPWLTAKQSEGRYIGYDPKHVLEQFTNYCLAKNPDYDDYLAAYRNAFEWDKCRPPNHKGNWSQKRTEPTKQFVVTL
jgi:hypothetical protein